eukprot:10745271-Ditylum_brightwellii.AAC.1
MPSMARISTETGIWGAICRMRRRTSLPVDGICFWEMEDVTGTSMEDEDEDVVVRVPTTLE